MDFDCSCAAGRLLAGWQLCAGGTNAVKSHLLPPCRRFRLSHSSSTRLTSVSARPGNALLQAVIGIVLGMQAARRSF